MMLWLFATQAAFADSSSASSQGPPSDNVSKNSSANQSQLDQAISLIEGKKYTEAFTLFQKLAESGDPEAQHNLALLYRTGKGVEKNLDLSVYWFRKAADQGVSDAQYYLGYMYDTGEGVDQNKKYAYVWYHKAAERGHGLAQINLGILYANGLGIQQDVGQAYLWFHVAAAQGYKAAFENKKIIEEALEPEKLEALKKEGQQYFQKYVLPYQRHSRAYPQLRQ
jgi:TPR repeat protein